jgi:hypothetical protein
MRKKSDTIEKVLSDVPLNVSFRKYLTRNNLMLWNDLVQIIVHVQLNNREDVFIWNLHQIGQFFVHSLYLALVNNRIVDTNKVPWRLKVPMKIKIFMWYMYKEVVLTKDNLSKPN